MKGRPQNPTEYKLNALPIQFPLGQTPQTPRATPEPSDRGEVRPRGNGSRKKQRSNSTVVKIYSFCNSYKNIGPWEHNAGALPRALGGPEHVRAWSLNFLCSGQWASACGKQDGVAGDGSGPQPLAQAPPEPFLRTPQPPELWSLSLPSCPRKLFFRALALLSAWGRGGRWKPPVLQMC